MAAKHEITRADVISMARYAEERKARWRALVEAKRHRRLEVGPDWTFYFENFETMWNQVHEMLFIEKGGEDQIADELSAYNPLVPKGIELVATVISRSTIRCAAPPSWPGSAASRRPPSCASAARRSKACPRPTWTAPAPPARPPRSSSSTSS